MVALVNGGAREKSHLQKDHLTSCLLGQGSKSRTSFLVLWRHTRNTSRTGPGRTHSLTQGLQLCLPCLWAVGRQITAIFSILFFPTEEIRVFTLYSQRFWGGFTPRAFTRSSSVRMALRWLLLSMVYGALENSSSVRVKSNLGGGVEANFPVRMPPYQHKYTRWAWGKAPNIWSNMTNS